MRTYSDEYIEERFSDYRPRLINENEWKSFIADMADHIAHIRDEPDEISSYYFKFNNADRKQVVDLRKHLAKLDPQTVKALWTVFDKRGADELKVCDRRISGHEALLSNCDKWLETVWTDEQERTDRTEFFVAGLYYISKKYLSFDLTNTANGPFVALCERCQPLCLSQYKRSSALGWVRKYFRKMKSPTLGG